MYNCAEQVLVIWRSQVTVALVIAALRCGQSSGKWVANVSVSARSRALSTEAVALLSWLWLQVCAIDSSGGYG